ncbi:hypothetical protein NBRC110019_17460 [Neptunitalea chrysea]|uniref:Uncharacterized protein n=1 Tax=Neptunitalea chrysea TaxID=1647581 RepID=A0A9W6B548_9FLAO|nr:hypothetical protein [Neptunitalea chrysea]GLB52706.1 hypothetical protein NBRC110019_17460 [Neptunitalea chrysea]
MKKKLESELISIAHKVLKLKGKEDIDALLTETQKLYEKLTVLKFVEEHFGAVQPTIGKNEVIEKFEEMAGNVMTNNKQVPESNPNEEDIVSPLMDTIKGMVEEMPEKDHKEETLDDILSGFSSEAMFVKKEQASFVVKEEPKVEETPSEPVQEEVKEAKIPEPVVSKPVVEEPKVSKLSKSLNDRAFRHGIQIGLNDRIGFVKHLFGGNSDDYNRVISQLNTATSFVEAQTFIEQMVKPDYNNWDGKEEYETRFYAIIEKKFD